MYRTGQAMMVFRLAMALTALVQATLALALLGALIWEVPVDGMYFRAAAGWVTVLGGVGVALWLAEHRLVVRRTQTGDRDFDRSAPGAP